MSRHGKKKKPVHTASPLVERTPRGADKAARNEDAVCAWDVNSCDLGGRWSWQDIDPQTWWDHICPARHSFSSMRWSEIVGQRHHPIPVSEIAPEAQQRLAEIEMDDVDVLYSFAVGSRPRIWGIRDRDVFRVLWWDPNHEIYPTSKS